MFSQELAEPKPKPGTGGAANPLPVTTPVSLRPQEPPILRIKISTTPSSPLGLLSKAHHAMENKGTNAHNKYPPCKKRQKSRVGKWGRFPRSSHHGASGTWSCCPFLYLLYSYVRMDKSAVPLGGWGSPHQDSRTATGSSGPTLGTVPPARVDKCQCVSESQWLYAKSLYVQLYIGYPKPSVNHLSKVPM